MNKTFAILFFWLAGFTLVNAEELINAPSAEDERAVISSATTYLFALDAGKYDDAHIQVTSEFQKTLGKLTFNNGVKLIRTGLGDIKARKVAQLLFIKDMKGVPPGIYAALFLDSEFQRVKGEEKVILKKSQGKWLIAGYFFEKSFKFNQPPK